MHTRRTKRARPGLTIATVVAVLAAIVAVTFTPPAGGASAALTLRSVGSLSHTLRGNYNGAGPVWEDFSTPAIGDITGDRQPELVMATLDGFVIAVRAGDRKPVWTRDLGHAAIQASPAIRQMAGSAAADVVIATMDGRVLVLDGPTGRTLVTIGQGPPLHCPAGVDCRPDGFFGTPALADVDGDGKADIVASSYDHTLYAWKANGQAIFRLFLEDTIWSSPVVADLDGEGRPEVVVGGDIYPGNNLHVPAGGLLWVATRAGGLWHVAPGYPRSIPGQVVWSTPAVADLNGDGWRDIVFGTGNNYPSSATTRRVYAIDGRSGWDLPGWPVATSGQVSNGPAIADLDHDGMAEAAFATDGGRLDVRNRTGSAKWSACPTAGGSCQGSTGGHGAVSFADLDGDGGQEVVAALGSDLIAYDGRTGKVKARVAIPNSGTPSSSTPTVAVVGGKAVIAVQQATTHGGPPTAGDRIVVQLFTTGRAPGRLAWPTFKRSVTRSG